MDNSNQSQDNSSKLDPECVFCKIIQGELPSYNIHEDENFLAFLDIFPKNSAQTVVIPKKHLPSKLTDNDQENILTLTSFAIDVAQKIEGKMPQVERCQLVIEGLDLNHLHIKLYPTFFPNPKTFVVSQSGAKANEDELERIRDIINSQ